MPREETLTTLSSPAALSMDALYMRLVSWNA